MRRRLTVNLRGDDTAEVLLYSVIGAGDFFEEGVTAKEFRETLKGLKSKRLNLRINSPGGSTTEAAAMLSALDEWKGRIEVDIDGLAASAASVVAMAGDPVRIAANGLLMVHDPYAMMAGGAQDMRRMADLLDKVKGQIVDTYARKTDAGRKQIEDWMAAETWFTGKEAVDAGFADKVTGEVAVAALAKFKPVLAKLHYRHAPERIAAQYGMPGEDAEGECWEPGDRIMVVPGMEHESGHTGPATVRDVGGMALGVEFDGAPGEIYRWYAGGEVMEMPDADEGEGGGGGGTQDRGPEWAETRERRRRLAALLGEKGGA